MPQNTAAVDRCEHVIAAAKRLGADAADAVLIDSTAIEVGRRLGQPEKLERAESSDLGLRVLIGQRQAVVSTSDLRPDTVDAMIERAVTMAKAIPDDPYAGLAEPDQIARTWDDLDLDDPQEPDTPGLIAFADAAEDAARAVDGVTNSEGAEASWGRSHITLVASNGFAGGYTASRRSLAVSVLAGEGTGMERAFEYTTATYAEDLRRADEVGRMAGERAVKRLNARKLDGGRVPVVFDYRVSGGFLGNLAGAINGSAVARGTSFLKNKRGERIMAPGLVVTEEPFERRGPRSHPFDGEGLRPRQRRLVDDGVLTDWILDLRTARQLGLESTGNASRGTGGPPSPSAANLKLEPGEKSPEALIGEIENGVFIDSMFGMGVNLVTGDYSRGFSGFWIENGEITFPVSEMTVAGNLMDMFMAITAADDFQRRTGIDAPTVRIDGMTVSGT